jgi:ketosteroid isomerase-like protein
MATTDNTTTARTCLRAWTGRNGDIGSVRALLADDMTFRGPLGETDGADEYVAGLAGLSQAVDGAEERAVVADGDDVCIVYDLSVNGQRIPTIGWCHFRDGHISSVRAFFDPRPMLG